METIDLIILITFLVIVLGAGVLYLNHIRLMLRIDFEELVEKAKTIEVIFECDSIKGRYKNFWIVYKVIIDGATEMYVAIENPRIDSDGIGGWDLEYDSKEIVKHNKKSEWVKDEDRDSDHLDMIWDDVYDVAQMELMEGG